MTNGKADMMSQVKEPSGDNAASSSREPGTSITTTEAEERVVDVVQGYLVDRKKYVAATTYCAQLLWIKHQPEDFGVFTDCVPLLCDNSSALNMAKNPVQHKRTNHIDARHHFLRDNVEKGLIYFSSPSSSKATISETPKVIDPSSLSFNIPIDQGKSREQGKSPKVVEVSAIVASDTVVAMEPIEDENIATIFVVSADGVLHEIISGAPMSQRNETKGFVGEGAMVAVEGFAPAKTTRPFCEELDPSPEETSEGSHSQASSTPASSPPFAIKPLDILFPEMRLQEKVAYDSALQKSSKKKKRRLVKDNEIVCDKDVPMVAARKVAYDSALQKSSKKKKRRLVKDNEIVCDKDVPVV
uniref:Uncharacterized protein LOC104223774 n=1 Tax=Nicotiana sylvestris TaxID=4096 RepID=A0A1U7WG14_NICSY